jgi:hypothetical protein
VSHPLVLVVDDDTDPCASELASLMPASFELKGSWVEHAAKGDRKGQACCLALAENPRKHGTLAPSVPSCPLLS